PGRQEGAAALLEAVADATSRGAIRLAGDPRREAEGRQPAPPHGRLVPSSRRRVNAPPPLARAASGRLQGSHQHLIPHGYISRKGVGSETGDIDMIRIPLRLLIGIAFAVVVASLGTDGSRAAEPEARLAELEKKIQAAVAKTLPAVVA